jgi:hypothetical protein
VIRTGNNLSTWADAFNRLVHPAGLVFFGEILIVLELVNHFGAGWSDLQKDESRTASSMRFYQPGVIGDEDIPFTLVLSPLGGIDNTFKKTFYDVIDNTVTASLAETWYNVNIDVPSGTSGSTMVKFIDSTHIQQYKNVTIQDAQTSDGSYVWDDYTVDDVINSKPIWKGVHLGVNLL